MRLVFAIPEEKHFNNRSVAVPAFFGGEPATVIVSYDKTKRCTGFSTVGDYAKVMRRPCVLFTVRAEGFLDAVVCRCFGDTVYMDLMKRLPVAV